MLSSTSDYALRAVLVLAGASQRRPLRAEELAEATGAPRNYLGKTLNSLVKAGVLTSARGPQGGFTLAIPAESLTLARVIDCFVEPRAHSQCLLGNRPCDGKNPCSAHTLWSAIREMRRDPLASTTVADLLRGSTNNN
jgi:Rrf2 family transcriptional regulator, iron-sulfur cluster assembly transcription factor